MTDELARLETMAVRQAWAHEAHHMTPWLAQNLDRLGDALGLTLELEGTEIPVKGFSADILATDVRDGNRVLIENQLEQSDHTHLGQIMTYLAGLDAKTMIWVAPVFRDPHLSAIRWLNEHTVDPFAFFAVQVSVVRIGNSPLAPVFEVLEKPNNWERQLKLATRDTGEMSETGKRRKAFWTVYYSRDSKFADAKPPGTTSIWMPVGDLPMRLSLYVAKDGCGLFLRPVRGADPSQLYSLLLPHAGLLETELEAEIGTEDSTQFCYDSHTIDLTNPANFPSASDWLRQLADLYTSTLLSAFENDQNMEPKT